MPRFTGANMIRALFLVTVFVWGTSWYAMRLQVGFAPVEVSICYRFILSILLLGGGLLLSARPPARFVIGGWTSLVLSLERHARLLGVNIVAGERAKLDEYRRELERNRAGLGAL